jgi:F0F1-type ATP synthase beta subunit
VLALSDAPTGPNLLRYLQASRELDAVLRRIPSKNAA